MKKTLHLALSCALLPVLASAQTPLVPQVPAQPLALSAAQDYARQARYPHWSSVLEVGAVDPLLGDRTPTRQSAAGPDGAGPRLTVWTSTISALPGETVTLFATLADTPSGSLLEAAAHPGSSVRGARIVGELLGAQLGTLGSVSYRDDGVTPDSIAGDGVYVARSTLPTGRTPALGQADSVMVKTTALLADEQTRTAVGGFQFSNPAARLTGRYTDALKAGNLVLAAEVEVLAPGRVYLSGTLANAAGVPFATAQAAQTLQPGKQWLELPFYGLAFHDRAMSGRMKLASVALSSTNGMPNALGPVLSDAHTTASYALTQFGKAPFDEPGLLETAKRLQRDAARSPQPQLP